LRHRDDLEYQKDLTGRLDDKDASNWLSLEALERELDKRNIEKMEEYSVYLHSELLQSVPKEGKQHDLILGFVRLLAQHPDTSGEFVDKDDTLRTDKSK
jgi:hypothetical protein